MKLIPTILILVVLTGSAVADVSDADTTFFHPAASLYIHGDTTTASNLVEQGLSVYPDDPKLTRLKELIKQDQDQQDQNQQDEQNQQDDQNQQDQQDQQQNQDQQEQQDQENQPQQEDEGNDQQEPQPDSGEQQADNQPQQPQTGQPEEMTPDEAKRLMDAMKQEEKNERLQLRPVLGRPVEVDKDW